MYVRVRGYLREIRASSSRAPGFCAVNYLHNFRLNKAINELDTERQPKIEDAALEFVKQYGNFEGSRVIIADVVGKGMHKYITPHLPDTFKHAVWRWTPKKGGHHKPIFCKVERCEPYKNRNSKNMVQEVIIHISDEEFPKDEKSSVKKRVVVRERQQEENVPPGQEVS